MLIDFPSDSGGVHLHQITKIVRLPGFVKEASVDGQREQLNELPSSSFADTFDRKFPIHTKAAAYLSYAYFLKQADKCAGDTQRTRIEQGFQKAAELWCLKGEYIDLRDQFAPKAAITKNAAALVVEGKRYFPINDARELNTAIDDLKNYRSNFSYPMRKEASANILNAAMRMGIPVHTVDASIHKMAGHGLTTKKAAEGEVIRRLNWLDSSQPSDLRPPLEECLNKLHKHAAENGVVGGEPIQKLAELLDLVDRTIGLNARYGESVPFPEDVLFGFTKSAAEGTASGTVSLITGSSYNLPDLEKSGAAFKALGQDLLDCMTDLAGNVDLHKVAEILPTLPRPDAQVLETALDKCGVQKLDMSKEAMVSAAVESMQYNMPLIGEGRVSRDQIVKEAIEKDPLLKRAADTMARLKETGCSNSEKKKARGMKGKYMTKAPNKDEVNILSTPQERTEPEKTTA